VATPSKSDNRAEPPPTCQKLLIRGKKKINLPKLVVEWRKTLCIFLYNDDSRLTPSQFPVTSQCCRSYNWVINPYRNGTGKVPTQEKIKKSFGFLLT